jgi:hypothetical protein
LFDRSFFTHQPEPDTYLCPAGKTVRRKQLHRKDRAVLYQAQPSDCGSCRLKPRCTQASQRMLSRHMDEDALKHMHQRATPALMRLRQSTVEQALHLIHRLKNFLVAFFFVSVGYMFN